MTYFKRYFKYRMRKVLFPVLIFTFLVTVMTFVILSSNLRMQEVKFYMNTKLYLDSCSIIITLTASIAALVLPISEMQAFKKARSLDFLLPMPASRESIAICHYLSGLIQLVAVTALPAFVHALMLVFSPLKFDMAYFFPMYGLTLYAAICVYTVGVFLFSKGNNMLDGIVTMFGFPISIYTLLYSLNMKLHEYTFLRDMPYIPLGNEKFKLYRIVDIATLLGHPSEKYAVIIEDKTEIIRTPGNGTVFLYAIWGVFAAAALIGFILHIRNYRAEKAGDISDSLFGYRLIIPLTAFSPIVCGLVDIGIGFMIIFVGMTVAYFVYRRSFRLKPADIAMIVFMAVIGILGGAL